MLVTHSIAVFACMSKVCAPPPAGKGGSLPSAGGRVPEHTVSGGKVQYSTTLGQSTKALFGDDTNSIKFDAGLASDVKVTANRAVVSKLVEDPAFKEFVRKNLNESVLSLDGMPRINLRVTSYQSPTESATTALEKRLAERLDRVPLPSQLLEVATLREVIDSVRSLHRFKDLSDEEVVGTLLVRPVIDAWADDATGQQSRPSQLAAAKVHGTSYESYKKWWLSNGSAHSEKRFAEDEQLASTVAGDVQKMIVRAEYAATQEWFKEQGIKSVTVYRGIGHKGSEWTPEVGDIAKLESNPLSSWTTEREYAIAFAKLMGTASGFHEVVLAMEVPVEAIQSIPQTGRGCLREFEVVLINKPASALIESVSTFS